jgi:glycosyltransferase involved in cell wall biosynthesis
MIESLTILIPTRNRPALLAVALASIRNSLGAGTRVLLGDNGDAEATRGMLAAYAGFDLAVTHFANPPGSRYTDNLQALVDACATPWFGLLHDDDFFTGPVADKISPLLTRPDVDFIFSDHWVAQNDGRVDEAVTAQTAAKYGRDRLASGPVADLSLLCVRQTVCLDGFFTRTEPARQHRLDRSLPGFAQNRWMPEYLAGCRGYYLADHLFAYRISAGSWTAGGLDRDEMLAALRGTRLPPGPARDFLRKKMRRARWAAIKGAVKTGRCLSPRFWAQALQPLAPPATVRPRSA